MLVGCTVGLLRGMRVSELGFTGHARGETLE
jgi:hypothetical protein